MSEKKGRKFKQPYMTRTWAGHDIRIGAELTY